ncbi:hypothetical protein KIN20_019823, partial [Parelaphostrongylus tenuis]
MARLGDYEEYQRRQHMLQKTRLWTPSMMISTDLTASLTSPFIGSFIDRRESIGTCSSVDESRHETLIMRYLSHGDLESATFWIDISYAEKSSKSSSLYEFAQYIK